MKDKKVFIILMLFAFMMGGIAWGATSGDVILGGKIDDILFIEVFPASAAQSIPLDESQTAWEIGYVKVTTNLESWKLKVYSLNGSKLSAGSVEYVEYRFTLGELAALQNVLLGTSADKIVQDMTGKAEGVDFEAFISYTGDPNLAAGTYTDTITVEVSAT